MVGVDQVSATERRCRRCREYDVGNDTLEGALALSDVDTRLEALARLGHEAREADGDHSALISALTEAVEDGAGAAKLRVPVGEVLGLLGDPRLRMPSDDGYFVEVPGEHSSVSVGRFPVTNHEFKAWVDAGGYDDSAAWSAEGRAWLAETADPWPVLVSADDVEPFVVPNQPVIGVTWYEADAYARAAGARLIHCDERVWVTRGAERRPYPWGAPFGEGNSNSREEMLQRPCAVGLFVRDATPEGVRDLAGNAAEWHGDAPVVGAERLVHPGCFDQPSLAAWAKALTFERPETRRSSLGFRLARDPSA
jgi:formylglycine-generating enzyme required for sulfatase activity